MSDVDPSPDPPDDDLLDDVTVGADDEVLARIRAQLQARTHAPGSGDGPVAPDASAERFEPDDDPTIGAVELPEVLRTRRAAEAPSSPELPPRVQPPRVQPPRVQPPQVQPPRVQPPQVQPPRLQAPPAKPSQGPPPERLPAPGPRLPLPEESTTVGWRPPDRSPRTAATEPTAQPPSRPWLVPVIAAVVVAVVLAVVVLL